MTSDVERVPGTVFTSPLDEKSVCEACGGFMPGHEWVDLDPAGFAVACSRKPS